MLLVSSVCIPPFAFGGGISSFAIVFFPSPWPGTASSTLLQLSMPPGNLAAQEAGTLRIKPRVGIFFVDFSCGILAVAFGCAVLLFMSDVQLDPTLFGRSRVLVPYLLLGVLFCVFTYYAIFCEMIHTIFLLSLTQSSFLQLFRSVLHLHRPMILIVAQVELSTKVICASLTIHAHKHLTW